MDVPLPLLLLMSWMIQVTGALHEENIALNKPASQVSDYNKVFTADKAVDGNPNTRISSNSCSHTAQGDTTVPKWWQVDLQDLYVVQSVVITNRGDCCGKRLKDFSVLVYKVDPRIDAKKPSMCSIHYASIQLGGTVALTCAVNTSGRFLRIQYNTFRYDPLALCEIEVKGARLPECQEPYRLTFRLTTKARVTSDVLTTYHDVTKMSCLKSCYRTSNCLGFNFQDRSPTTVNCELFSIFSTSAQDELWNMYYFSL